MGRQLEKYDAVEKHLSINDLANRYEGTYLDPSFNRLGGFERGSGWTIENCELYMGNLFENATVNVVIVASVPHNLARAEQVCKDPKAKNKEAQEDLKYWKNMSDQGMDYVAIDGNNTSSTIYHFINGELCAIKSDGSKFHADSLNPKLLHEEKTRVFELREITYIQMTELFRALNQSTKLNRQEFRQAKPSEISNFVRKLGNAARKLYLKFVLSKDSDLDKRVHEEELAKYVHKVKSGFCGETSHGSLDFMYDTDNSIDESSKNAVEKTLSAVAELVESGEVSITKMIGKAKMSAFIDLVHHIHLAKLDVLHVGKLFETFLENDAIFVAASADVPEKEKEESSYSYWLRTYNKSYNKVIEKHLQALDKGKFSELIKSGTISEPMPSRGNKDKFTFVQKLQLYALQGGKDRKGGC